MNILAIDPGPVKTAWVIYDTTRKVPVQFGIEQNGTFVDDTLPPLVFKARVGSAAIEMIASYGMAVGKEVFETCVWIGVFLRALTMQFVPTDRVYRKDVKMHLCGSMRAKDGNIRQALIDKIGPQGTKKAPGPTYGISKDVWAALAVAVCYAETKDTPAYLALADAAAIGSTAVTDEPGEGKKRVAGQ